MRLNLPPVPAECAAAAQAPTGQAGVTHEQQPDTLISEQQNLAAQPGRRGLSEVPPELFREYRVATRRWWLGAVIVLVTAVILFAAVLGYPREIIMEAGEPMVILRILAVPGVVVSALCFYYFLRGALQPEHVHVSREGVSTPRISLTWDEIEAVTITGDPASYKGRIDLTVPAAVFNREGPKNRWLSGRPLGTGGLIASRPVIRLQAGTVVTPKQLAETMEWARLAAHQRGSLPKDTPSME